MSRTRDWCLTLNNPTEDDELEVYGLEQGSAGTTKYGIVGIEVGANGTTHFQGFIQWVNTKSLDQVRELFGGRGHWEPRRGTPRQAAEYCRKDNNYHEWGTCGLTQSEATKASNQERWELAKAGRFEDLAPECIRTYEYIHAKYHDVEDREDLDNIWIFGPSGCGKSRYCRTHFPGHYNKPISKWWDGYNHQPVVVIDDIDPNHAEKSGIGYYLKIWGDHYAFNAEVKGGMLKVRPKTVVVTSQYHPRDVFKDHETLSAITRRFKIKQVINGELYEFVDVAQFVHA